MDTARTLLPWVLPPLLGAIIGYLTNALAIRMLFRPLAERRFLGLRVPFTPGVIPRGRYDLAQSIGRMVSRELLTTDVFARRFASPGFARSLQRRVVDLIDRLGDTTIASLRRSLQLDHLIAVTVRYAIDRVCTEQRNPGRPAFVLSLEALATRWLEDHRQDVAERIARVISASKPLAMIDTPDVKKAFAALWPAAQRELERLVYSPAVQAEMAVRARRLLHFSLDQLTSFQRLFVSAAQYDRQLESRIPAIVTRASSEILQALEAPGTRGRVEELLLGWIADHREKTAEELVGAQSARTVESRMVSLIAERFDASALVATFTERYSNPRECRRLITGFARTATAALDRNEHRKLKDLMPVLSRRRASMARLFVHRGQAVLERATESFVTELDVHSVVVDRINDLDVARVEELILGIMRRHLTWINLFGAVLGALIGGIQILLRVLGLV